MHRGKKKNIREQGNGLEGKASHRDVYELTGEEGAGEV